MAINSSMGSFNGGSSNNGNGMINDSGTKASGGGTNYTAPKTEFSNQSGSDYSSPGIIVVNEIEGYSSYPSLSEGNVRYEKKDGTDTWIKLTEKGVITIEEEVTEEEVIRNSAYQPEVTDDKSNLETEPEETPEEVPEEKWTVSDEGGELSKDDIDFSKIANTAMGAVNENFLPENNVLKQYWGDNDKITYKVRDDGAVILYEGDVPMGFTTKEALENHHTSNANTAHWDPYAETYTDPNGNVSSTTPKSDENVRTAYWDPYNNTYTDPDGNVHITE